MTRYHTISARHVDFRAITRSSEQGGLGILYVHSCSGKDASRLKSLVRSSEENIKNVYNDLI
jgi:hypothetical protein